MKPTIALTLLLAAIAPTPAIAFELTPTSTIGNVRTYTNSTDLYISSGTKGKATSSLSKWLAVDYTGYNGGSAALFKVAPGSYEITWQMYTSRDEDSDFLGLWNGSGREIQRVASSAIAMIPKEYERPEDFDRWRTDTITTTFTTESGDFALFALDGNRRWDSTWKLESFNQVAAVPEPATILGMAVAGSGMMMYKRRRCAGASKP
jgi:hypothetical protein